MGVPTPHERAGAVLGLPWETSWAHAGSIPCVPKLGQRMRPAQRSYGCLLSDQVGLALAQVHLFAYQLERTFIGCGE